MDVVRQKEEEFKFDKGEKYCQDIEDLFADNADVKI